MKTCLNNERGRFHNYITSFSSFAMTTVQDPYKMRPATPPTDDGLLQQKPMQQSNASRVRPMRSDMHTDMRSDMSQSNGKRYYCQMLPNPGRYNIY